MPTLIRDDFVPVLAFQTETDVAGAIAAGGLAARQPDSSRFRLWEVAGTAHFDLYGLQTALTDTGRRPVGRAWFDSMRNPSNQIGLFTCASPINSGPQTFVLRSAISHLARWVDGGRPPPEAPRLEVASAAPFALPLDANGNVRGGIRTPAVDACVANSSAGSARPAARSAPFRHHQTLHPTTARHALSQPRQFRRPLERRHHQSPSPPGSCDVRTP